jgi:hypothetical protein
MPNGGVRSEKSKKRKRPDYPAMKRRLDRGAKKALAKAERAKAEKNRWFNG